MGVYVKEIRDYLDNNKAELNSDVFGIIREALDVKLELFDVTDKEVKKFFVEGYEELSEAVFNLLYSGRGRYIINYANKYGINRKAAGFSSIEDLVHYAMWVITDFSDGKKDREEYWDELKLKIKDKSEEQMLKDVLIEQKLMEELREVSFNIEKADFAKRLQIIECLKTRKTLVNALVEQSNFNKVMDFIFSSLENIPNVHMLNIEPEPIDQDLWERSMV